MIPIYTIRKIFVRQLSNHDCGVACLSMLLNYAGRANEILPFKNSLLISDAGLSLYDMQKHASNLGFSCRCVEMSIDFLKTVKTPVILHMINNHHEHHYQVCFGARIKKGKVDFLMADPSRQVYYMDESSMENFWKSKAALYFDKISVVPSRNQRLSWRSVTCWNLIPAGLWCSVPIINIAALLCGVAVTWVLQKGISDSFVSKSGTFLVALPILLLIITMFKSLLNFLRQAVLLKINLKISRELTFKYIDAAIRQTAMVTHPDRKASLKRGLADNRKIQTGLATFLSGILTEGSFLLTALLLLWYFLPLAGLLVTVHIVVSFVLMLNQYPETAFYQASFHDLAGKAEEKTLETFESKQESCGTTTDKQIQEQMDFHGSYMATEKNIALDAMKFNLLLESIGNLTLITVFILGLLKLEKTIDYATFMMTVILTFLITSILPRLYSLIFIVSDGIASAKQQAINFPDL
jgi:ABC-type bacteriocin/lantibiotic exporter with double-glycine peptidase domain